MSVVSLRVAVSINVAVVRTVEMAATLALFTVES
jgi:hypothetical protein